MAWEMYGDSFLFRAASATADEKGAIIYDDEGLRPQLPPQDPPSSNDLLP